MTKFESIAQEFRGADAPLRLELLIDYAQRLPELPEKYRALRDAGLNLVHECQAPVFLAVEVEDGKVRLFGDVPREAPTARGFTSIMIDAFDGADAADVEEAPLDALHELGLDSLLGMQRTRGLSAIYRRIKDEAGRKTAV
ncbi:MAG TPA: SufE family protein [Rhodothermales bacterium]|nr:SufE family protein [Rhodothermales bacterium]